MPTNSQGAISSFAPTGRNVFLRLLPEQQVVSYHLNFKTVTYVGFLLLVIKYWKSPLFRSMRELCQLKWILCRTAGRGALETQMRRMVTRECCRLQSRCRKLWTSMLQRIYPLLGKSKPSIRNTSIHTNQQLIRDILHYWFGQYTPDESQKKLWMIANSSVEQRRKIDADIANKFESILLQLSDGLWKEWCEELYNYQGKLAAIICLDQFSRHLHRHNETQLRSTTLSVVPSQFTLDSLAYHIAQLLFEKHSAEITNGMIPLPMYIFGIMPYRHASTLTAVAFVQTHTTIMTDMQVQLDNMIRRFRKATNRRMAVLQDASRRTGTEHSVEFSNDDILEAVAFRVDMGQSVHHLVHTTIATFLKQQGVVSNSKATIPVVVSLSGGVDSMVIASVLAHMANTDYNIKVYAIHIDYGNRPEAEAEAAFVENYCHQFNMAYICRRINEVTRGVTARDDYERIARELRYQTYRATVQECRDANDSIEIGVMLGHHRGDLRENVLSNAHKGCGPLDLSGMKAVSQNDGVVIYRPLLPLEKDSVFDYAHTYGVPYFKDTTPHWSTRGKLRNKLIPLLEEIYGEGSMNNLSTLATESDDAYDLLHMAVLRPFLRKVEHHAMGITFETTEWQEQGLFFWKFVLREALHSAGLGMFSDKSVAAFLVRIQMEKVKSGWLQCRKDYAVYLREDGKVFVLFASSFPFRKVDQFNCIGQKVTFLEAAKVGPWIIQATIFELNGRSAEPFLEQKAIESMEKLMNGRIMYYMKTPKSQLSTLVFTSEYSKASRPDAWKNTDAKLQKTLPILANEDSSVDILNSDFNVVCIDMKLIS